MANKNIDIDERLEKILFKNCGFERANCPYCDGEIKAIKQTFLSILPERKKNTKEMEEACMFNWPSQIHQDLHENKGYNACISEIEDRIKGEE